MSEIDPPPPPAAQPVPAQPTAGAAPTGPFTLAQVNALAPADFARAFGRAYEHSPWVAERAFARRPFAKVAELLAALRETLASAEPEAQLALLRAHPMLALPPARLATLTAESPREPRSAGLDALTAGERVEVDQLNQAYMARHGFPFIIAVRLHTRDQIIAALRERLPRETAVEHAEALRQVARIAGLRVADLLPADLQPAEVAAAQARAGTRP